MTQEELAAVFDELAALVRAKDSWEGLIEYLMPEMGPGIPDPPPEIYANVRARYRIGNSMGQGGMRFVGGLVSKEKPTELEKLREHMENMKVIVQSVPDDAQMVHLLTKEIYAALE